MPTDRELTVAARVLEAHGKPMSAKALAFEMGQEGTLVDYRRLLMRMVADQGFSELERGLFVVNREED